MEPVAVLKRKRKAPVSTGNSCLFCEKKSRKGETTLRNSTEQGKTRIREVVNELVGLKGVDFPESEIVQRLADLNDNDWSEGTFVWHKSCYGSFSTETRLERLRQKSNAGTVESMETPGEVCEGQSRQSRSSVSSMNWECCIFCQVDEREGDIRNISTMSMSQKVLNMAVKDVTMRVRLAGVVGDLCAAEGKYHLNCWVNFQRAVDKMEQSQSGTSNDANDIHLDEICLDIIQGLSSGHVYDMAHVWRRYEDLCSVSGHRIPDKYSSRRQSFYDDVKKAIGPSCCTVRPLDPKSPLLLYPSDLKTMTIASTLQRAANEESDSSSQTSEDTHPPWAMEATPLEEIVHTALQLRADLRDKRGHNSGWHGIDNDHVLEIIPDSLYLFLSVLFGGEKVLGYADEEEQTTNEGLHTRICSIAQDIIFTASKSKKLTPKHIGLGLALHQATRSENLVNLFHAAGHTIGIDTVRRIDTTIANDILRKYEQCGYIYIPSGIVPYQPGRIVLASFDNIDVLEETLDGKNTFHVTQCALWQRGPPAPTRQISNRIQRDRTPDSALLQKLHELDTATITIGRRPKPIINGDIDLDKWNPIEDRPEFVSSVQKNQAWVLARMSESEDQKVPSWAAFNEACSYTDLPVTTIGMMPILLAPADDNNTVTTVLNRFCEITKRLGQKHVVITGDQPLYSRTKELIWANPLMYSNIIVMMGDLHILFNFLKAIGQHLENSGLEDIWIEAGTLAQNSTNAVLEGKAYYRAVRSHQLAYEALCRIKWTAFRKWVDGECLPEVDRIVGELHHLFSKKTRGFDEDICVSVQHLVEALETPQIQEHWTKFDALFKEDPNYSYWSTYMELVDILLSFIRALREGNWKLYLQALGKMLPWWSVYDHSNYARWAPVYYAEMLALETTAPDVFSEFMAGNFVVKKTKARFNQVPVDQATEWMNKLCKVSNGIIGITKTDSARDRFGVTWGERSVISDATKALLCLDDDESISTRKDGLPARVRRDEAEVKGLVEQFMRFGVFSVCEEKVDSADELNQRKLVALTTKDVATDEIQADILGAKSRGINRVLQDVKSRLVEKSESFFDPMKKQNSKTFANLYKFEIVTSPSERKVIKADRRLMQRLVNAQQCGRVVDMSTILKHELAVVPLSLAKTDGTMHSTTKSDLLGILSTDVPVQTSPTFPGLDDPMKGACVLIDGHALIQSLGKPVGCKCFGDYADAFARAIFVHFRRGATRIDVIFDRYLGSMSIKGQTRVKRGQRARRPIRKIISDGKVPLPQVWAQFVSLGENKADLASFLSDDLMSRHAEVPDGCELIVGGGFASLEKASSARRGILNSLSCDHEEADTRIILHGLEAIKSGYERLIVHCRDTDVFLLLLYFFQQSLVWMIGGTSRDRRCYPVHEVSQKLSQPVRDNLLGFHALTGSDTTSSFTGYGKKSCWKVFVEYPHLLHGIGRDGSLTEVEEFVCRLYSAPDPKGGVNQSRFDLFRKGKKQIENLPPTEDALKSHLARANYQAKVWFAAGQCNNRKAVGLPSSSGGWRESEGGLAVVWITLPAVPVACLELMTCGCKTKCRTAACKCHKSRQMCIPACRCESEGCCNPATNQ